MSGGEVGPALPPGFGQQSSPSSSENDDFGPALPPSYSSDSKKLKQHGPAAAQVISNKAHVVGPTLPPADFEFNTTTTDSSDDELVGPSLDLAAPADRQYDAAEEFAARNRSLEAEKKRIENEKSQNVGGREEWMMSLPTVGLPQDIGITARTFRNKAAPQQDSSWTKGPADKQADAEDSPKKPEKRQYEDNVSRRRDDEISEKLGKYNDSKRQQSLYDMHQKKLKKEKKKAKEKGDKSERVPFSRETDLEVNKFDEAQRKSVIKKAALLDTRFGHGSQKYE